MRTSVLILCIVGCGPGWAQTDAPSRGSDAPGKVTCASLAGVKIPATAIGLPTSGATVKSATLVAAAPEQTGATSVTLAIPEYCKVVGAISPVDKTAPDINFQVNFPTAWNQKAAQFGGSGMNGSIPRALTSAMNFGPESIPPNAPYALSRGFMVYGSDSGHGSGRGGPGGGAPPNGGAAVSANWAANTEALTNFGYAQLKKTHDVAFELARTLYGSSPRHSYFFGSSQGGREALMAAQRFPQDYDGVFSQVPVLAFVQLAFDEQRRARQQSGDSWIPPSKVPLIAKEVLRQCDGLDGIEDGLVGNYSACNKKFDPATGPNPFAALRCPDGKDAGDACLSDAQITAANAPHARTDYPYPLYKGWTSFPGWGTGGESVSNWIALRTRPDANYTGGIARTILADAIARDASVSPLDFPLDALKARVQDVSATIDAIDPDLSAFRKRGGKLILKSNTADYSADPRYLYEYYEKVVATMSKTVTDDFVRYYVGIGIGHNNNIGTNIVTNEHVPNYFDVIAMLDNWVEKGAVPPDAVVLQDMETVPPYKVKSSLPMCRYPQYPRYKGQGDPKTAASYACVAP